MSRAYDFAVSFVTEFTLMCVASCISMLTLQEKRFPSIFRYPRKAPFLVLRFSILKAFLGLHDNMDSEKTCVSKGYWKQRMPSFE